ncbi:hypothetical protein ABE530_10650 [Brucella sp. TWI559]
MSHSISDAGRFQLQNDLESEVTFLRDLVEVIAENLLEINPSDFPERAKDRVRIATTLAVVTRDRATEACRQMDKLFEVAE